MGNKKQSIGMKVLNHVARRVQVGLPGKSSPVIKDIGCVIAGTPKVAYQLASAVTDATAWLNRKAKRLYRNMR